MVGVNFKDITPDIQTGDLVLVWAMCAVEPSQLGLELVGSGGSPGHLWHFYKAVYLGPSSGALLIACHGPATVKWGIYRNAAYAGYVVPESATAPFRVTLLGSGATTPINIDLSGLPPATEPDEEPPPLDVVGRDFGGAVRKSFSEVVARVSPPSGRTASDFAAAIDWGDGQTSTGVLSDNDGWARGEGGIDIIGHHSYDDWNAFRVTVTVTELTGDKRTQSTTLTASIGEGVLEDTPPSDCTNGFFSTVVAPVGCRGRIIASYGNVISASRVAVVVPGVNQNYDEYRHHCSTAPTDKCPAANVKRMIDDRYPLEAGNTAVVAWLGYDTPPLLQRPFEVASQEGGQLGAEQLQEFVRDLLLRRGDSRWFQDTLSLIGHSYGTTVVARAVAQGLRPTNVVFVGSPGTDVDHVGNLGMEPGRVFAGKNPNDLVPETAKDSELRSSRRYKFVLSRLSRDPELAPLVHVLRNTSHNVDPTSPAYGAHVIGTGGQCGHEYFSNAPPAGDPNPDTHYFSQSLANMASIVTANYVDVTREERPHASLDALPLEFDRQITNDCRPLYDVRTRSKRGG